MLPGLVDEQSIRKLMNEGATESSEKNLDAITYGVYVLWRGDEILYIGEGEYKDRLWAHCFITYREYKSDVTHYQFCLTGNKENAINLENELLEEYRRRNDRSPKYN